MTTEEPIIFVSADGHIGAEPEAYRDYLDPEYRDQLPALEEENAGFKGLSHAVHGEMTDETLELIDGSSAMRSGGGLGAWDMRRRREELDREGVAAEVLIAGHQHAIQPFFSIVNKPHPPDVRAAGARAYHRFVADCIADGDGRLVGVAEPGPCLDMDATVRELHWAADHGFVSVAVPGNTFDAELPPIYDDCYEPYWAACADRNLVLSVHAGWGQEQGKIWKFAEQFTKLVVGKFDASDTEQPAQILMSSPSNEDSPLKLDMGPRRVLWQLMLGGVFDRYDLKLAITECRADWLPDTLAVLDARFDDDDTPLLQRPSEYWERHCFVTASSIHRAEIEMRDRIGVDQLMFGVDYPHPEGTWPNTWDWLRFALAGVQEDEARRILGENAIRCYGLDRGRLAAVAARIGPKPSDLLGEHAVDPDLLVNFDERAGLRRPAEVVDAREVDGLFQIDVKDVVAAS
jgi:predicted TIM-barrel fold metal-dependent hydrolase